MKKNNFFLYVIFDKYKQLPVQVKASFWFMICAFMQKSISMITTPIFTRLLSTAEYGKYNVFNSWYGILTVFISLYLSAGVYTQGLVKYENDRKTFSSSMQGLSTTLVFLGTIVYLLNREFWNKITSLSTIQMLMLLLLIWTTSTFNFWSDEQRVLYKYKLLVIITVLVSIAKPIVEIVFVTCSKDKVTARILGLALVEVQFYSIFFFIQIYRGKKFVDIRYWKIALKYNLPLIPHYLSQTVLNSADRIMISRLCNNDLAGIYSLAYSISSILLIFNTALMQTLTPWMYQKIKARKIDDIKPIGYLSLIIIAVLNLLVIMFAPEIVKIFAPSAYYDAIEIIPPVAMSVFFMYGYDLFSKYALYYEKTHFIMGASIVAAMLNIVLNYIAIPTFGYKAAGYTTLICYIAYFLFHFIVMKRICNQYCNGVQPYSFRKLTKIVFPFVGTGILFMITYNRIRIRYGIIVIVLGMMIIKREVVIDIAKKVMAIRNVNDI